MGVEQATVYRGLSRHWPEFPAQKPVLAGVIAWN